MQRLKMDDTRAETAPGIALAPDAPSDGIAGPPGRHGGA